MNSELNFPKFSFNVQPAGTGLQIFCTVRKKWIALTPEEWVRQHMLRYLIDIKHFPASLIAVEKQVKVVGRTKRFDIMCANPLGRPMVLIECKAPDIPLSSEAFDQAARYNLALGAPYMCVTNGFSHFFCQINDKVGFDWFDEIPDYSAISSL